MLETIVGFKKIHENGVIETFTQAGFLIEIDGISVKLMSEDEKELVIQRFRGFLFGLKWPVQIFVETCPYDYRKYITDYHIHQQKEPSFLRNELADDWEGAFEATAKQYGFRENRYYIWVGTKDAATWIVEREVSDYLFKAGGRYKYTQNERGKLENRANWILQQLRSQNLSPRIMKRDEIISLYHRLYNPFTQAGPRKTSIVVDTPIDLNNPGRTTPEDIGVEILEDGAKPKTFKEKLAEDLLRAEEEVKKATPLGFLSGLFVKKALGENSRYPLGGKGLLKNDPDLVAPEFLEEKQLCLEHQSGVFTTVALSQLPNEIVSTDLWLNGLLDLDTPSMLSIHINPVDPAKAIKILEREMKKHEVSMGQDKKDDKFTNDITIDQYRTAFEIKGQLARNEERWLYTSVYLGFHTKTEAERKNYINYIDGVLAEQQAGMEQLFTLQMEGLRSVMPFGEDQVGAARNITTSGLATFFPFTPKNSDQGDGLFLGQNLENNSLIKWDPFNTDAQKGVSNPNVAILGISGAGKTLFTQTLIHRFLKWGRKLHVIDVLGNYQVQCKRLGGQYISFGPQATGHINPFELFPGEDFTKKIGALKGLFDILIQDIDQETWSCLEEILIEIYIEKGKIGEDVFLRDIVSLVTQKHNTCPETDSNKRIYKKLGTILGSTVNGSCSWLFNNKTSINPKAPLVVYDISDLESAQSEDHVQALGLYVVMTFCYEFLRYNKQQKTHIVVDEVWALLKYKVALAMLKKIAKTIRNMGNGIIVATQNIEDFKSDDGRAIIGNCSTRFLLQQKPDTLQAVKEILGEDGSLSDVTSHYLIACSGSIEGIRMLAMFNNRQVALKVIPVKGEIIEEYALNSETIRQNAEKKKAR